jgi:Holliday junction resolvase RusA-like endonuclease
MALLYSIPLNPVSKKNSQMIVTLKRAKGPDRPTILPSAQYRKYEQQAAAHLVPKPERPIDIPVRVQTVFYMQTRRRVDMSNLIESAHDVLVKAGILADDNRDIIASVDGSRVLYDKNNPRTEILIEPYETAYAVWSEKGREKMLKRKFSTQEQQAPHSSKKEKEK